MGMPLPLNHPDLQRRVNALRATDNYTNWLYIAREYLVLAGLVGLTIAFYQNREAWGLHWAWNVPVSLFAMLCIGGGQHRLSTLAHEASHYMLFKHRLYNELVSDLLCMFPLWGNTHHYRLQHMAHHQFVNHPEHDPDLTQMQASGHRFPLPMSKASFLWHCVLKQLLWPPNLIRYMRSRARYNATGGGTGPYETRGIRNKVLIRVALLYLAVLAGTLTGLVMHGDPVLLAVVPVGLLAAVLTFYYFVPEDRFRVALIKSDLPPRWMTILRMTHFTITFCTLAWLTQLTGNWWAVYYIVLWLIPLATTFAFFMILRQVVQHGNADQERLTNTRIFHTGIIGWAVFPLGMDYHLPHHLFPMVPHYRLRQLHALLLENPDYHDEAVIVDGYFLPARGEPRHPTVLELMAR